MRNFFARLGESLSRFMQGRYGADSFSLFLTVVILILILVSPFTSTILSYIADVLMIYVLFRMLSRNIEARKNELAFYNKVMATPKRFFSVTYKRIKYHKTTRYYVCKTCKTVYSLPKGKGKIKATCPQCKNQTIHTT